MSSIFPDSTMANLRKLTGRLKTSFLDPSTLAAGQGDPAAAAGGMPPGGDPMAAMGGAAPPPDPAAAAGATPAPPGGGSGDLIGALPGAIAQAIMQSGLGGGAGGGAAGGAMAGGKPPKIDPGVEIQIMNRRINKLLTVNIMALKEMGIPIPPELALEPDQDPMMASQVAQMQGQPAGAAAPNAAMPPMPAGAGAAPAGPQPLPAPFPQLGGGAAGGGGAPAPAGGAPAPAGGGEKKGSLADDAAGFLDRLKAIRAA